MASSMDLPSDSDESDVDFVPEGEEDVSAESEAEADEETDALFEVELAKKNAKRAAQSSKKIPRKKAKVSDEKEDTVETEIKKSLDPEAEKKHEEDLWASFLGTPKQCNSSSDKNDVAKIESMSKEAKVVEITKPVDTSDEKVESNEKECPVEEVGIETGKTNKPSIKPVESNSKVVARGKMPLPPGLPAARKSGGGLASVLNRIGKKDKLSTLEKSKQDWMSFKKDEGIEEEIQTHNRGKDGYLERQDFLQRTDLRQFEIEKSLRTNKRSNR